MQAPAGMYRGYWNRSLAVQGREIPPDAFHEKSGRGYINAGLMRFDPLPTLQERNRFVEEMLAEVEQIDERDKSYLPELLPGQQNPRMEAHHCALELRGQSVAVHGHA